MPTKGAFRRQESQRRPSPPYGDKEMHRSNGHFCSRKCGQVQFWTPFEYRALMHFEADPTIFAMRERPERVMLRTGPQWVTFVPSFELTFGTGRVIVELSPFGGPRGPRQERAADLIREHYRAEGTKFVEVSQIDLRARPRSIDARILLRYRAQTPTETEILQVRDLLHDESMTIEEARRRSGVPTRALIAMLRRGDIVRADRGALTHGSAVTAYAGGRS